MSTNANIRIKRADGTQTGIYLHWDGYIEHAGLILQFCYNTAEKVEKLLSLGNLSIIGEYTEPQNGEKHDFSHPVDNVCVAYHRDRGDEFQQSFCDEEFVYTFDEEEAVWRVSCEEYIRDTKAQEYLELGTQYVYRNALLLDEIIDKVSVINSTSGLVDDEIAESGLIVETCIKKAIEARKEIIEEKRKEAEAYYRAYCD